MAAAIQSHYGQGQAGIPRSCSSSASPPPPLTSSATPAPAASAPAAGPSLSLLSSMRIPSTHRRNSSYLRATSVQSFSNKQQQQHPPPSSACTSSAPGVSRGESPDPQLTRCLSYLGGVVPLFEKQNAQVDRIGTDLREMGDKAGEAHLRTLELAEKMDRTLTSFSTTTVSTLRGELVALLSPEIASLRTDTNTLRTSSDTLSRSLLSQSQELTALYSKLEKAEQGLVKLDKLDVILEELQGMRKDVDKQERRVEERMDRLERGFRDLVAQLGGLGDLVAFLPNLQQTLALLPMLTESLPQLAQLANLSQLTQLAQLPQIRASLAALQIAVEQRTPAQVGAEAEARSLYAQRSQPIAFPVLRQQTVADADVVPSSNPASLAGSGSLSLRSFAPPHTLPPLPLPLQSNPLPPSAPHFPSSSSRVIYAGQRSAPSASDESRSEFSMRLNPSPSAFGQESKIRQQHATHLLSSHQEQVAFSGHASERANDGSESLSSTQDSSPDPPVHQNAFAGVGMPGSKKGKQKSIPSFTQLARADSTCDGLQEAAQIENTLREESSTQNVLAQARGIVRDHRLSSSDSVSGDVADEREIRDCMLSSSRAFRNIGTFGHSGLADTGADAQVALASTPSGRNMGAESDASINTESSDRPGEKKAMYKPPGQIVPPANMHSAQKSSAPSGNQPETTYIPDSQPSHPSSSGSPAADIPTHATPRPAADIARDDPPAASVRKPLTLTVEIPRYADRASANQFAYLQAKNSSHTKPSPPLSRRSDSRSDEAHSGIKSKKRRILQSETEEDAVDAGRTDERDALIRTKSGQHAPCPPEEEEDSSIEVLSSTQPASRPGRTLTKSAAAASSSSPTRLQTREINAATTDDALTSDNEAYSSEGYQDSSSPKRQRTSSAAYSFRQMQAQTQAQRKSVREKGRKAVGDVPRARRGGLGTAARL